MTMTAQSEPANLDRTCGTLTKRGTRCGLPAGWGTEHVGFGSCRKHLGTTRNRSIRAAAQVVDRDARALLAKLGEPQPMGDPVRRLRELAGEADQWLDVCRAQVAALEGRYTSESVYQGEQVRAMVREYTLAIERVVKCAEGLVKLGFEERRVRVEEAQAVLLAQAVDTMLAAVVPAELHDQARTVLGAELRRLDAKEEG